MKSLTICEWRGGGVFANHVAQTVTTNNLVIPPVLKLGMINLGYDNQM